MGWSSHHPTGLIHYSPQNSYRGYTLVASNSGYDARLIDMGPLEDLWEHLQEPPAPERTMMRASSMNLMETTRWRRRRRRACGDARSSRT